MVSTFKLIIVLFLSVSCTGLIYQPDKYFWANPEQFKIKYEPFMLDSLDGTKLSAWKLVSKEKPKRLVLFFHGNAQNLTAHYVTLHWLVEHQTDVIIFDYRGYGISEGKPNPKGVSEDGLVFLNYAYEEFKKGGYKQFVVYTQSLGGAIALKALEDFKHRDEISLLVLDSTFLSPRHVARDKTNFALAWLISNNFTADPKLSHITMPVLSIHSKGDKVINYDLGVKLYEALPTQKKQFWSLDVPGHGDVYFIKNKKYRAELLRVLDN